MATKELKKSIYRILSDLTKFDRSISIHELDNIDAITRLYGITSTDKQESYSVTLATAAEYISRQKESVRKKVIDSMENCALKDGECSRDEAMLISAIEIACESNGRIISLPLNNRPVLTSQILFVDPTYNPKKNELDRRYDEIKTLVELAGFELIYIPKVAESFKGKQAKDLERLLLLINPTLSTSATVNKVMSLQDMDSRYFYIQVLNGRLGMGLDLEKPTWLIRLQDSTVNGVGYANYLCHNVDMDNIYLQLKEYTQRLNRRQNTYSITVNRHSNSEIDFSYDGFHKALLDVMATDRIGNWEIKVYVRAGSSFVTDNSGKGEKFSISINRGNKTYPVLINGREAAYYLLLLCASAGPEKGIIFEYERERSARIQEQYEAAYRLLSNRDSRTPDITNASTLRPIKAKVMSKLKECGIKGDLHLFKPTKKESNHYYIPLPSENVKVVSSEGESPLKDSTIFKTYLRLGNVTHTLTR